MAPADRRRLLADSSRGVRLAVGRKRCATTAVHQEVHQRAQEQQRVRQEGVQVRGVLGDEKECCDAQENDEGQAGS